MEQSVEHCLVAEVGHSLASEVVAVHEPDSRDVSDEMIGCGLTRLTVAVGGAMLLVPDGHC